MQKKILLPIPLIIYLSFLVVLNFIFVLPAIGDDQKCCWLKMIDDPEVTFDVPNIARPNYLETIIDPVFKTKITRITGDPGTSIIDKHGEIIGIWGDVVKHHYSKDQPWNADESLIHLVRNTNGSPSDIFLDGQTYRVLFAREVPGHDNRWHPTNPDLKIYLEDNQIGYFNVYTGEKTIVRSFTNYTRIDLGPWEGNLSYDGRLAVFYAKKLYSGYDVFAYDIVNNFVYPAKDLGDTTIDWASISAGGQYIVIMYHDTNTQVYDLTMNLVSHFSVNQNHYDLGIDNQGEEVAAGISKNSPYDGLIVKHSLSDAALIPMTTGGYAIHTSTRNNLLPGWSYSSFHPSRRRYRDEIVAIKMDGTETVRRFCHMHNNDVDYYSEAMPVPSHDGKRVIFASNWDEPNGRPVGTYVVDARVPCSLNSPALEKRLQILN